MMKIRVSLFGEAARIALQSIWAHKLRTFLTLLGIIIGVASVMVVGAGIEGMEVYVLDTMSRVVGTNSLMISRFPRFGHTSRDEWEAMVRRNPEILLDDVEFVARRCPDCQLVGAEIGRTQAIYAGGEEIYDARVNGTLANEILLGSQTIAEGRFFSEHEVDRSRFVCVIGSEVKEKFFPSVDAIGRSIKIRGRSVKVVGVFDRMGTAFGQSLDKIVYMPVTAYQKIYGSRSSIRIKARAASRERFETALEQARLAMRIRHKLRPDEEDDFGIISSEEINEGVDQFTGAIAMVVTPITLISLIVGGIVVMNIMLVSVTERTFEIGLRKSVGARQRDVLYQFLLEAFVLAAVGGVIGLLLAAAVSWIVESSTPIPMSISLPYVLLSVSVAGGIGIIFGIYPAFKASRLDPIVALTTER